MKKVLFSLAVVAIMAFNAYATINLNTTTAEELVQELGISRNQANLVISYRNLIGRFTSLDQLYEIPGLDEEVIEQLRDDAQVEPYSSLTTSAK